MKKLKNSLIAIVVLAAIVALISLVTPMSGKGQENGSPPARDVNVVNTPSVNVVNTATSPVLVRDVESGREPFQETTSILISSGIDHIQTIVFAVPEGKRGHAQLNIRVANTLTAVKVDEFVDAVRKDVTLDAATLSPTPEVTLPARTPDQVIEARLSGERLHLAVQWQAL